LAFWANTTPLASSGMTQRKKDIRLDKILSAKLRASLGGSTR
jgi:hypothetical protein